MFVDFVSQIENIRKILFIVGEDDQCCESLECAKLAVSQHQAKGLNNYELLQYPGAGHLIDIPYMPVITTTRWGYAGNIDMLKGEFNSRFCAW